jgi:hypothetical protein
VRTGRPVSVHRAECRVLARSTQGEGRAVELGWNQQGGGGPGGQARVSARLAVSTVNRPGSLGSVTTVIGKQGANIVDVRVGRRTADLFEMLLDVEVESLDHLQRVQGAPARDPRASPRSSAIARDERRRHHPAPSIEAEVLAEFRAAGALLEGHFILTSGLRSPFYLQCARVLMDPRRAARLVTALVPRLAAHPADLVVSPSTRRDRVRLRGRPPAGSAGRLRRAGRGPVRAPARLRRRAGGSGCWSPRTS